MFTKVAIFAVLLAACLAYPGWEHGHARSWQDNNLGWSNHHGGWWGGNDGGNNNGGWSWKGNNDAWKGNNDGWKGNDNNNDNNKGWWKSEGQDDGKWKDDWRPAEYKFKYGVEDHKTGDNKEQWEKRDGDKVEGEYSLHEADGTIRTVKYIADKHNGFQAKVIRHGKAVHPQVVHKGHGW